MRDCIGDLLSRRSMLNPSSITRLAGSARRLLSRVRRPHLLALAAVAAGGLGAVALAAMDLPGPRPLTDERMRIEVVRPVEPDIVPGGVMEVGELVDGFEGVPPSPPAPDPVVWEDDDDWEAGKSEPAPPPRRLVSKVELDRGPEPAPPRTRAEGRWFGFDLPRRDYQAERAARRARLEALDQRARDQQQARRREWNARRDEARDHRNDGPWREESKQASEDWRGEAIDDREFAADREGFQDRP